MNVCALYVTCTKCIREKVQIHVYLRALTVKHMCTVTTVYGEVAQSGT